MNPGDRLSKTTEAALKAMCILVTAQLCTPPTYVQSRPQLQLLKKVLKPVKRIPTHTAAPKAVLFTLQNGSNF